MKQQSIFMGIFIIFYTTACSNTVTPMRTSFVQTHGGGGGNPEVNLNICLSLKNKAKSQCLDTIFPNSTNILILPSNGKHIKLAGRGSSIEKSVVTLKNDDILLLNIETSTVKLPLTCNIKTAKLLQEQNSLVVSIPVKDIDKKITLKNREGKLLLDYSIIKE